MNISVADQLAHKEGQIGSLDIIIRMLSESWELFVVVVGRRHLESACRLRKLVEGTIWNIDAEAAELAG